ncbi:hypothetical protein CBR_g40025 [Chara braunii]|uniref:CCHC-type domain-containing protein n=1 Tax=Chara braunii TaxID=69332 RepID=A0A388LT48_CHABU|nr:hypothetical protein CBR_g40025 [Chara braunii]|eukprot:GBG85382.1 hypothetical protein CBR_g40025 [Chara braunii]
MGVNTANMGAMNMGGVMGVGGQGMGIGGQNMGIGGQHMGMGGQSNGTGDHGMGFSGGASATSFGTVTCFICGKTGHYSRNCWQAAGRQRAEEDPDMKGLLRKIAKREKDEEERKLREAEEEKKKQEQERREGDKLREAEAKEAQIEATIVRILSQRKEPLMIASPQQPAPESRKRSPRTKTRMLRKIRSYIAESDNDSEEVKEEADKLIRGARRLEERQEECSRSARNY